MECYRGNVKYSNSFFLFSSNSLTFFFFWFICSRRSDYPSSGAISKTPRKKSSSDQQVSHHQQHLVDDRDFFLDHAKNFNNNRVSRSRKNSFTSSSSLPNSSRLLEELYAAASASSNRGAMSLYERYCDQITRGKLKATKKRQKYKLSADDERRRGQCEGRYRKRCREYKTKCSCLSPYHTMQHLCVIPDIVQFARSCVNYVTLLRPAQG